MYIGYIYFFNLNFGYLLNYHPPHSHDNTYNVIST